MRARVSLVALVILGACSSDTAIVLSIHADLPAPAATTRFEVFLGVGPLTPVGDLSASWWRRAPVVIDALDVGGPLADRTFALSLSPSADLPLTDEIVFAVAGYAGDALVGFAHSVSFVRFADGEARRIDVPLLGFDPAAKIAGVTRTGCAWWNAGRDQPAPGARDGAIVPPDDADCDDFAAGLATCGAGDCADRDPAIHPGAVQDCTLTDTDCCDQTVADPTDADGDGWRICDGDCNDRDPALDLFGRPVAPQFIHPGQVDTTCNGVDEACTQDGCDAGVVDTDGDGYVTCQMTSGRIGAVDVRTCDIYLDVADCLSEGAVDGVPAAAIHPGAEDDGCDGVDQDCDGHCDNDVATDADADGWPRCPNTGDVDANRPRCPAAVADCDDEEPWQQPGSIEACDGIDSACDDQLSQDHFMCLPVVTASGACTLGTRQCTEVADGQPAVGPCGSTPGAPTIPDRLCAPCANGGDPLACDDTRFRGCGIHTTPSAGTVACTAPLQHASLGTCNGCTWTLENGTAVDGWKVALVDRDAVGVTVTPGRFVGNAAALRAIVTGPRPQGFVIKRVTLIGEVSFEVVLLRHDPTPCAPVTCSGGAG